jgi:hypothetical protein
MGRSYEVIAHDTFNGKPLLVLKTGDKEHDYQLVYPDEVKFLKGGSDTIRKGKTPNAHNVHKRCL